MRCPLILLLVLIHFSSYSQEGVNFSDIAEESSEALDDFGYSKPEFKWNMEGRVQAALNDGINYLDEGSPNLALPQLEEAIKLSPHLWVSHYYKGICLKQLGQYPAAEAEFLRVNELNDKVIFNYVELAKTYDLMRDFPKGERWFERAAKLDDNNVIPVYLLANHCAKTGMIDRAKRLYKQSLAKNPKMLDAEVKLAIIDAVQAHKPKSALRYLDDVLAKDSLHKQALIFRGILKIEDINASLNDWDKLVTLSPGNVSFRFVRGMLLTEAGNYERAFSDLRKVIDAAQINSNKFRGQQSKLDKRIDIEYAGFYVVSNVYGFPDDDALRLKKAYCLLFPEKYAEALKSINEVKGSATSPLCLFMKGLVNEHKGSHHDAYKAYDSALRYDNDIIDAHKKRGIYLMEMKEWKYAETDFTHMLRINPEAYVAYRFRGLARIASAQYIGALNDYTKYLKYDSTNKEVRAERAMVYKRMGDHLPSTLDLLMTQNFQAIESFDVIQGEINKLLAKNDTTKALWWLEQFIKQDPRFINAHKSKLALLAAQKKWEQVESCAVAVLQNPTNVLTLSPSDKSALLTAKGLAMTNLGDAAGAIKELNAAVTFDKKNSDAYVARAEAQLRLSNKKSAAEDLARAAKLGNGRAADMLKSL